MTRLTVPGPFEHRVQFYDSDAFLEQRAFEFLESAWRHEHAVIVFATGEHLQALQARLRSGTVQQQRDGEREWAFVDAHTTLARFMVDGLPDPQRFEDVVGGLVRQASRNGSRAVTVFSELVGMSYAGGNIEAALRLEKLLDGVARRDPVSLLCAYPMSAFADREHSEAFQRICAAHAVVDPIERLWDIHELHDLHRMVAQLQQRANALERELGRQRDVDDLLASQNEKIVAMASMQAKFEKLASQDPLTGLSNRRVFNDRLTHAMERATRSGGSLGLIFIDINNFKSINDSHGHAVGDILLNQVAGRLNLCARTADTVCRWGGDEFGIITEDTDEQQARVLIQRIAKAMRAPFEIRGQSMVVSVSAGLSLFPDHAATIEALLHNADAAMYRAKRMRKARAHAERADERQRALAPVTRVGAHS